MPTYYFDIRQAGVLRRDDIGLELPDIDTATLEGRRALAELTREAAERGELDQKIEITVRDHGEGPIHIVMSISTDRP